MYRLFGYRYKRINESAGGPKRSQLKCHHCNDWAIGVNGNRPKCARHMDASQWFTNIHS